jgi:hypothetical protein
MNTRIDRYADELLRDWKESVSACISRFEPSRVAMIAKGFAAFVASETPLNVEEIDFEKRLDEAEARLGIRLPSDYVAFMRLAHDNWPITALSFDDRFLSLKEVDFFLACYPMKLVGWMQDREAIADLEQVAIYGAKQRPELFCSKHLAASIAITSHLSSGVYLLNSKIQQSEAWEAWVLDAHFPGAMRFPTFFALVEYEIPRSISELESTLASAI